MWTETAAKGEKLAGLMLDAKVQREECVGHGDPEKAVVPWRALGGNSGQLGVGIHKKHQLSDGTN